MHQQPLHSHLQRTHGSQQLAGEREVRLEEAGVHYLGLFDPAWQSLMQGVESVHVLCADEFQTVFSTALQLELSVALCVTMRFVTVNAR